jgi:hypothetical protein
MRPDHQTGLGIASFVVAALLTSPAGGCASEPKPRPTVLDPSNPAAPESQPLAVSALGPSAGLPTAVAPTTADPPKQTPGAPTSEGDHGSNQGGSAPPQAKAISGEGGRAGEQPAIIYTCPMHPEVTSDKPGHCPKCGMKLVPKEPHEGEK